MTETPTEAPFYNPLQDGYDADPYTHQSEMRELAPVQQTLVGPWALFRHRDVFELLRDPKLSVSDDSVAPENLETERYQKFEEMFADSDYESRQSMLSTDPPDHTRLRRLVSKAFTPRSIEQLRPSIQALVDEALDTMEAEGVTDVIEHLAFPLPFDVITEMLGMPEADQHKIRDWSEALVKTLDPIITDEEIEAAFHAGVNMNTHIEQVIEWKRSNPGDDLLTAMIEAEEDGDRLSSRELRDQVSLLFVAGHETTVNLIGTGLYELLRHPDQLALLADDPSLDANMVDELLRFVAPVQFSRRITTSDHTIDGQVITAGSFVLACLASANRDPELWGPTADELDITRDGAGQHVSFGSGAHYCLGASLAKLEAELAIGSFVRRFPTASIAGDPEWNGRINLRGLSKLPVEVAP